MKKRLFLQGSLLLLSALSITSCGNRTDVSSNSNNSSIPTGENRTIYVSNDGKSNNAGTLDSPKDIVSVLNSDELKPGDTVILKAGTYSVSNKIKIVASGSFEKTLNIKSDGGTVTLDFRSMKFDSSNRGVTLTGDYINFTGINICGAGDNGLYISGDYNIVSNCEFYNNRDSGLQLGRESSDLTDIKDWPSYNLIQNCTSYNNYDNETYGENADGFAAKLTVGYGNVFDGCIAYRNSDDGWDLYAKSDTGNIGCVTLYNCVAFDNGFLLDTQRNCNDWFGDAYDSTFNETNVDSYLTRDGDGNGFKLGGSTMVGDVSMYNCLSFNNRLHGVTDNSNPGVISVKNVTSYNNSASIDDDKNSSTFGQIINEKKTNENEISANFDLARSSSSYNNFNGLLSIQDGTPSLSADAYRGSTSYSIFDLASGKANKITESIDAYSASTTKDKKGTEITSIKASDVFVKTPSTWTLTTNDKKENVYSDYAYNFSGKGNKNVHKDLRNSDGSINMGDILDIKSQSTEIGLFGDEHKIGASLSETSASSYTHPYEIISEDTEVKYLLHSARSALYLNTDLDATYQDFNLITSIMGCNVSWTSSDTNIIKIGAEYSISQSKSESVRAIVYRQNEDKNVTLTAKITYYGQTVEQTFNVVVKADEPELGDMSIYGLEGTRIIVDQYQSYSLPSLEVSNGADDNGKLLDPSSYTLKTKYEYATDKNATYHEVSGFTTSKAGVYKITQTATLNGTSKSIEYYVFVASKNANVDFVDNTASVIVNRNGYSIEGNLTNVTGSIISLSSDKQLTNITSESLLTEGSKVTFRNDSLAANFDNPNNGSYYVYYALANANGTITSQIYEKKIDVVNISTADEFVAFAANNDSTKIYTLINDIDLSNISWKTGTYTLKGLLNGKGHKITNLNIEASGSAAMFNKMDGGTIENVIFEGFTFKNTSSNRAGLFAQAERGDFYNIQLKNISIEGGTGRTGALVGNLICKDGSSVTFEQISLINDDNHKIEKGADCGGLVGLIQSSNYGTISFKDCYVDAQVSTGASNYAGGLVGRYADKTGDVLTINNVVVKGKVSGTNYVGGIIGGHQNSAGKMIISRSTYLGDLYFGSKLEKVTTAQKNCSNIVGRYSTNQSLSTVYACYALFEEANSNYSVNLIENLNEIENKEFYSSSLQLDLDNKWTFDATTKTISLNFIDTWTKA